MKELKTEYQIWYYNGDGGYSLIELESLEQLPNKIPDTYTVDFYVTKRVKISIKETQND